jgi:hypothetical protein
MTTSGGGGGPGPDDQPNNKVKQESKTPGGSRKRGKPEEGTIPAEEQQKPEIIIDSPSRVKKEGRVIRSNRERHKPWQSNPSFGYILSQARSSNP